MNPKTAYSLVNFIPILSKLYGKGCEYSSSLESHFIQLCREPKNSHIIRCKLSKGKYLSHLNKSFITTQNKKQGGKSFIAQKFCESIEFKLPTIEYGAFVEQIDTLINKDPNRLLKLAFDCFDFNDDGFIDEVDIYCVMKLCDLTAAKS